MEEDDEEPVIEEVPRDDPEPANPEPAEVDAETPEAKGDAMDEEVQKIEKEKEGLTAVEKLERSLLYKAEGNDFFRGNDPFKAADCYYRAVLFARDLMQNPKHYPKLGHNEAQRETARSLVESSFCNLALVQSKHAIGLPAGAERERILREAARSAGEALRVNPRNAKALYRRGLSRAHLARAASERALAGEGGGASLEEAQGLCAEARADLTAAVKEDEGAREARAELRTVHELSKRLKREELSRDKRGFSFEGSLSALQPKEEDILGDGSVRKQQTIQSGDGAKWFNEDWLRPESRHRCVVQVKCSLRGGKSSADAPVLSFALDDADMHEGIRVAARSLTKGEVARFALAPSRMVATGALARRVPQIPSEETVWEIELRRFAVYEDKDGDGTKLLKVFNEGWGRFPDELSECHLHWKVTGPDDATLYSSRYMVTVGEDGGGIQQKEDPERAPYVYILGETMWPPVEVLCRSLRQGGRGELRLKHAPALPEKDPGAPADGVTAQLSSVLNKRATGVALEDCAVLVELERVLPPLQGPDDAAWGGVASLIEERFSAEQLLERGEEAAALRRFRRGCTWAARAHEAAPGDEALAAEEVQLRSGLAWLLAARAAPILDLGTVSSNVLRAAEADLAEAEAQCAWLEENRPGLAGVRLVRAKLLVAREDDFEGAQAQLLEAQRLAPDDVRVQRELREVREALRQQREAKGRERVVALREGLAAAREGGLGADSPGEARAAELLAELATVRVSWEVVMETRVGAELKRIQEATAEESTKRLCTEILGRWMDESKEQRPLWEK